jgi:hypothetical protein
VLAIADELRVSPSLTLGLAHRATTALRSRWRCRVECIAVAYAAGPLQLGGERRAFGSQSTGMLSETNALEKLHALKTSFVDRIRVQYQHRAKSCLTCETKGACCLDAHFVNVQITKLEAVAIRRVIDELPNREKVAQRVERAIVSDGFFACPLFEKGVGCLVHERGKPLPCITHACYENKEDLPPDELLEEQEGLVEKLNRAVYRKSGMSLPLPTALRPPAA